MAGKLTDLQKKEAIARRLNGESAGSIAKSYGVSASAICYITKSIPKPPGGWKRNRRSQLTDDQKKEILRLVATMSYSEIARHFSVGYGAVAHYLRKVRPPEGWGPRPELPSKLSDEDKEVAIRRRMAGETLEAIAQSFNVSLPVIHKIVKHIKLGYNIRRKLITSEQVKDAIARRLNGESLKSIGESYGVTGPCIHKITKNAVPPEGWPQRKSQKIAIAQAESLS